MQRTDASKEATMLSEDPELVAELQSCGGSFWYLATPYSKYESGLQKAYADACAAAASLLQNYKIRVFSPIAHTHSLSAYGRIDPRDHEFWLSADKPFIDAAYGGIVLMMPGWQESRGIQHEIDEFIRQRKPLHFVEYPL